MNVRLVSMTQDMATHQLSMTPEEIITYCARVSNPSNQGNHETAPKLIKYLIDHKHWSPFEMVNMGVEVTTSRAISQQILRHWSISIQEFSTRYSKVQAFEPINLRIQSPKHHQGGYDPVDPETDKYFQGMIKNVLNDIQTLYNAMIDAGIAKECARDILPLCSQTTMYMNASIRDWIHYLTRRIDPHAQWEHRIVANEIQTIFIKHFPNISEALGWLPK